MTKEQKVSILLLNWNGISYTKHCVESLLMLDYSNYEIIVLDNGSDNNEAEILDKKFSKNKKIRIIKNGRNIGYAAGMNKAFTFAQGKYVLVTNNDMRFEKDYLTQLVRVLKENPKIAICQPKLKNLQDKDMFDYSIAAGGHMDLFGYLFARGRIFTFVEKDKGQYDTLAKISWCGIFLARKNVLEKTGLFDPIYFNYGEDGDLCFRIYGQGYIIVNNPKAVGYHISGGAMKKNLYKKMFFHHRNNVILILKNFPTRWLLLIIFPRIFLDFVAIFYYLYRGSPNSSLAVLGAYVSLIRLSKKIWRARKKVQPILIKSNLSAMPVYKGCIIYDFFIRGKETFAQIMIDKSLIKL